MYAPDLLVSERAQALVEQADPDRRLALSAEAFRSLSDRDDPQGIAAVVRIEDRPLSALPLSAEMLVVVAYQLSDPGNLGAIIRTADAAGATGVIVVTPSVDLYDPQTVRATMGSLFALPVIYPVEPVELERWVGQVRAAGVPLCVVASSAHGRQDYFEADYRRPLALLVGNERYGLPPDDPRPGRSPRPPADGRAGHVAQRVGGGGGDDVRSDPPAPQIIAPAAALRRSRPPSRAGWWAQARTSPQQPAIIMSPWGTAR